MISPETQEHAIREYCASHGHTLADAPDGQPFLYGIDESGSQRRSSWWRKLDQAVSLVEAGEYDGIVVWKFSRTARHRLKWAVALDRVETAGGVIESATEQFDTTTSAGRFARGMVAEMNAFEAERIGETWTEAHMARVRAGLPHSGKPRWGYLYDRDQKMHLPHPDQGPVLADMYARYVAGESVYALVRWLNAHGWRTNADRPWSDRSLRRVLDSGFASGRFSYRGVLHDGQHEALISDDLWQAYQDARAARRTMPARVERSPYLLSGMVRCARCGGTMNASYSDPGLKYDKKRGKWYTNGGPSVKYRCKRAKEQGGQTCRGGYIKMELVEEHVRQWLEELAAAVDESAAGQAVAAARRTTAVSEAARLAREAAAVHGAMTRLVVQNAERPLPASVFDRSMGELEERARSLAGALQVAERTARRAVRDPAAAAAGLLAQWETLPVAARREVLRGLMDCVLVRSGRGVDRFMLVVPWERARA